MSVPRNEYPRPDFERRDWLNLNGEWQFEVDNDMSGEKRGLIESKTLSSKIILPFAPESKLSGIGNTDFMCCVWYKREVDIPESFEGKRVILHIGACDYHTKVWVGGRYVGEHFGGYTEFRFDITDHIQDKKAVITVCAYDNTGSSNQPSGKQSHEKESFGCFYTRTTGIWQTVWLEAVNKEHIVKARYYTDIDDPSLTSELTLSRESIGAKLKVEVFYEGRCVGSARKTINTELVRTNILLSEKHLWELGVGRLYDLYLTVERDGCELDSVKSYFGLRSVAISGRKFLLNGKSVFQRTVLDQGFYPDGIYTAPTEQALIDDIKLSMELGFNGARLHQKVFEPRFLYHCDKLGYMVWGEYASWGLRIDGAHAVGDFSVEFGESIDRDFNHPSIIGWCPLNEVWDRDYEKLDYKAIADIYMLTKAADPTRPVIDASGGEHTYYDIYDVHDYTGDIEQFKENHKNADFTGLSIVKPKENDTYFVSEYGGIGWQCESGWGYGEGPKELEEFYARYKGLTDALLDNENILGFCYTQLYDVEQEQNGLLTYSRCHKFDPERIACINKRKAKIED